MLADQIEKSSVVSLVSEEESEDGGSYKALLRITDMKRWSKMVVSLLKSPESTGDTPTFGVSIRKEYYLDEDGNPTFCWVLFVWGELDDAFSACGPILGRSYAPPPPPAGAVVAAPAAAAAARKVLAQKRKVISEDGTEREITVIPLGGHAADRNAKGNSKRRAFVENTDFSRADGGGI